MIGTISKKVKRDKAIISDKSLGAQITGCLTYTPNIYLDLRFVPTI
jgi:hypothetical protein